MNDPVRKFEHAHGHLTKLALDVRRLVRAEEASDGRAPARLRKRLVTALEALRDELLRHFANEEEGLFPFVRANLPAKAANVDRLADAHDAICGAIVRLADFVDREASALGPGRATLLTYYERFESAYTQHSQDEAALFDELGRTLDERQRTELASLLRGL